MAKKEVRRLRPAMKGIYAKERRPIFVKQWRIFRGLSQTELGKRCGVTHGAISQLENGLVGYSQFLIERVAHALKCEVGQLVSRPPTEADLDGEIWHIWSRATEEERGKLTQIARILVAAAAHAAPMLATWHHGLVMLRRVLPVAFTGIA